MNQQLKSIGASILERCCKPHLIQECMRTFACLYGDYKFLPSAQNVTIQQAIMSYNFDDIKQTDIVLDIGAHVGGFSIIASSKADKVYAVEPLYTKELIGNIELNDITNIETVCCGLGDGVSQLEFNGKTSVAQCYGLKHIINTFCGGHVDFLKIDCEGWEWSITPADLDGIRRIEGEIHKTADNPNIFDFVDMLQNCGYVVNIGEPNATTVVFHATHNTE